MMCFFCFCIVNERWNVGRLMIVAHKTRCFHQWVKRKCFYVCMQNSTKRNKRKIDRFDCSHRAIYCCFLFFLLLSTFSTIFNLVWFLFFRCSLLTTGTIHQRQWRKGFGLFNCRRCRLAERIDGNLCENSLRTWTSGRKRNIKRRYFVWRTIEKRNRKIKAFLFWNWRTITARVLIPISLSLSSLFLFRWWNSRCERKTVARFETQWGNIGFQVNQNRWRCDFARSTQSKNTKNNGNTRNTQRTINESVDDGGLVDDDVQRTRINFELEKFKKKNNF